MDQLPDLMRQAERCERHNTLTSAVSDAGPSHELPAAPSIREALVQPPLFHVLPPPAAPHSGESSLPTLAASMKRSAADAGLDDDAVPDGKRVKVSHAAEADEETLQASKPETLAPVTGRKRNAFDAGLDDDDQSPAKRLRQDEPDGMQDHLQVAATGCESPPQVHLEAQETSADAYAAAKEQLRQRGKKLSIKISPLLQSAIVGDLNTIQAWLQTPGIDINEVDENGFTVLYTAVTEASIAVVKALLAMPGIDVNAKDKYGKSVLYRAVGKDLVEIFRTFLAMPEIDVNAIDKDGKSALYRAVEKDSVEIVQALLAMPGIDINVEATVGRTALLFAAKFNHRQIAVVLAAMPGIDVQAIIRDDNNNCSYDGGCTAFMVAAAEGNLPLVRTLLTAEAIEVNRKNNRGYTALMLAALRGHLEIVRALLAVPGIDIEAWSDKHPSRDDCMDYYDENGNSVSWRHAERPRYPLFSALSLAKTSGRTQIVEALLAMPASPRFVHFKLAKNLSGGSYLPGFKYGKKSIPTPEETYRFLRQILHPGLDVKSPAASLPPQREQIDPECAAWIDDKCITLSLGACPASEVPFLLQSTIPMPTWCQASFANAIALGFTAGHYHNAPDLIWQAVQGTRAWIASLAFGAGQSRQDAIELEPGICYQLESMHLWKEFLNTLERLRPLKADPDGCVIDKLTLLGRAARDGNLPMIKTLVALGANIHLRSPNGDVPIVAAARAGQWAACAELFSLGAMLVMGDNKGYPALYYIASAFAHSSTVTPALATLIRYLRLKNVRFDIPAPNPDERDREQDPTVLVSDILFSNPESWVRFGKVIYGIAEDPLPALPVVPAPQIQQAASSKAQVYTMFQLADAEAALAAWLDADPQHLHWRDPDTDQTLLHLATASQNIGLVQLLLARGIGRTQVDRAGQTAVQLLPADYMSSYTPAAGRIAALLR